MNPLAVVVVKSTQKYAKGQVTRTATAARRRGVSTTLIDATAGNSEIRRMLIPSLSDVEEPNDRARAAGRRRDAAGRHRGRRAAQARDGRRRLLRRRGGDGAPRRQPVRRRRPR